MIDAGLKYLLGLIDQSRITGRRREVVTETGQTVRHVHKARLEPKTYETPLKRAHWTDSSRYKGGDMVRLAQRGINARRLREARK